MKVTFFVSSLGGGGAEKMMLRLAEQAAIEGHSVELLIARKEGNHLNNTPKGVKLVVLNESSRIKGLIKVLTSSSKPLRFISLVKLPRFLTILQATCNYYEKRNPDLVISTLHTCNLANIMARECTRSTTKVIVRECIQLTSFILSVPSRKRTLLPFIKLLYPLADKIVSVAKQVENDLLTRINIPKEKSITIYNPVIGPDFYDKANMPVDVEWLNDKNTYVILGVGRLSKQKDFSTLIKAFSTIKPKAPNMKLLIIGEGEQRAFLQRQIDELKLTDSAILFGFVDNPLSYMCKADLFVLPSLLEGAPNVLVEAMACGCQIICTDSPGGSSELLKNGEFGSLVPMRNSAVLAEAIFNIYKTNNPKQEAKDFALGLTVESSLNQYIQSCFPN